MEFEKDPLDWFRVFVNGGESQFITLATDKSAAHHEVGKYCLSLMPENFVIEQPLTPEMAVDDLENNQIENFNIAVGRRGKVLWMVYNVPGVDYVPRQWTFRDPDQLRLF